MSYVVTVTFRIVEGQMERFMPPMLVNAATSLEAEPGCRQFDVCTIADRPDAVFLYEVYDDRAAFEAHLASDHFKVFDAAVAPLIAAKEVLICQRVQP